VKNRDYSRQILEISSPWKIVSVKLDMEAKRAVITINGNSFCKEKGNYSGIIEK
jgi:hypothetical protein